LFYTTINTTQFNYTFSTPTIHGKYFFLQLI
jgi:hypothetical protein